MVMGWGVAVMGRWGGCGFGFGLHLHASKVEVTVTGSFFVVLLPFFSPSPPATFGFSSAIIGITETNNLGQVREEVFRVSSRK